MAVEWSTSLETGVEKIDCQHKELFSRVDKLFEACKEGKGKQEVSKILDFLEVYVIDHFSTEEKLMDLYHYKTADIHKEQHKQFINSFLDLKAKFEAEGATIRSVTNVNRVVVDWLIKHISDTDKQLGTFLKSKN